MIEFEDVRIAYKDKPVLDGVSLTIHDREFFVLIGSSGCGKTTLLKSINKLLPLRGGSLSIDGIPVEQIKVQDLPKKVGYVVQSGGLFPHLTVEENIALTMQIARFSKEAIRDRVDKMLKMVNLDPEIYRGQYPSQLSGGQQQRVALARALVTRPSILLLDEPLSNLDAKLRVEMQVEIKRIQKELGITTIIVTHDHEEAVSLADRVIVMNAGHILQIGKPQEVFDRPASPFIADFMGFSTFLHGIAAGAEGDMRLIRCGAHTLQVPAEAAQELTEGDACILAIRSENIRTAEQEGVNTVRGTVKSATYKGHTTRLEVSGCFEEMVYPAIHEYADVQEGSEVLLHFPAQHFCVYKDIK